MGTYPIGKKKVNRNETLLFIMAFVFVNYFVYFFISRERYIYFWDYYQYWEKYQNLGNLMINAPAKAFSEIWRALRHDDYNLLPVLFLMPFRLIFGEGRLAYILSVANVYAFPAAVLSAFLVGKVVSSEEDPYIPVAVTLATSLLFPQFWIPILFGYPDVAGIVVVYGIFMLAMKRPIEEQKMASLILLGVLLAFLVMLRRWYAYWVVSFFVAMAAQRFLALFPRHHFRKAKYLPAARNILIAGITSSGLFILAAGPIAKRMIATDYADIYSAYKRAEAIIPFLKDLVTHLGIFASSLFVIALAGGVMLRKTRDISTFLFFHLVCVIVLFSRVQNFSEQHYYLIIPSMILSISILIISLYRLMHFAAAKSAFLAAYIVMISIQFWLVFVPQSSGQAAGIVPLFSADRHYPLVRDDLGEIRKLLDVLEDKSHGGKEGVYVIASSIVFNDDILRNACRAFDYPQYFCDRIFQSSHVDKVHGFPQQFLSAMYVVVAKPVQYHLMPEGQRVVGVLAEDLLQSKGIGSSFDRLPEKFVLDNSVLAHIYHKTRPLRPQDLRELENRFQRYYPRNKDIFKLSNL